MSANTAVVPPTSAYVPAGAAAWAPVLIGPSTACTAVVDAGSTDSVTVYAAVALSALSCGGETEPTSVRPLSLDWKSLRSAGSSAPEFECSRTTVGSVAPGGRPFSSVFSAVCDSALAGMPAEPRSNVGLKLNAATESPARITPETTAKTSGRRRIDWPMAAYLALDGSRCHDLDGQKTLVPSSDTTAGIRVRLATRVVATAIASAGPIDRSTLSVDSSSARKATMTTPAAVAMARPARLTALIIACLLSSPARRASR